MNDVASSFDASPYAHGPVINPAPLTVCLEPFGHQVGGHALLAKTNGRILKPMILKELSFYQRIWAEDAHSRLHWLRQWTPGFYGLFQRDVGEDLAPSSPDVGPLQRQRSSKNAKESSGGVGHNPWVKKLSELRSHVKPQALYLSLEDLTARFKRPCILDCKMGTRTYDDDALPAKRQRHIDKCRRTTSGSIGTRFNGMQVYRWDCRKYLYRDKYYGRELRREDLPEALRLFLDNGVCIRLDVVRDCLSKLRKLLASVDGQNHFMFYSSSLLLIYEGSSEVRETLVDVRLIDFAHTQPSHGNADEGFTFGLRNIVALLEGLLESETREGDNTHSRENSAAQTTGER